MNWEIIDIDILVAKLNGDGGSVISNQCRINGLIAGVVKELPARTAI